MSKYLCVTMPDGSRWKVPATIIADHRASYYASQGASYDEELAVTLRDNEELIDWAANNMNWTDVEARAVRVAASPAPVDYHEGWRNGEKEVVDA